MRIAAALLTLAPLPALAADAAIRPGFALSDLALAGFAAVGLWLARRAMRARFRKRD